MFLPPAALNKLPKRRSVHVEIRCNPDYARLLAVDWRGDLQLRGLYVCSADISFMPAGVVEACYHDESFPFTVHYVRVRGTPQPDEYGVQRDTVVACAGSEATEGVSRHSFEGPRECNCERFKLRGYFVEIHAAPLERLLTASLPLAVPAAFTLECYSLLAACRRGRVEARGRGGRPDGPGRAGVAPVKGDLMEETGGDNLRMDGRTHGKACGDAAGGGEHGGGRGGGHMGGGRESKKKLLKRETE